MLKRYAGAGILAPEILYAVLARKAVILCGGIAVFQRASAISGVPLRHEEKNTPAATRTTAAK